MKLIQLLLVSTTATFIVACNTNPVDQQAAGAQAEAIEVKQENTWLDKKPQVVEQLRTNARLRVQEPDTNSISIQIRSTDSFPTDGVTPSSQLLRTLDDIVTALDGQEGLEIEVAGHTDNTGNAQRNLELSADRAKSVADYLNAKGSIQSVIYVGYGSDNPLASNTSREGRAVNRRIDLLIKSLAESN